MRGDPERTRKQPQEVERADRGLRRSIVQIDWMVRIGVDPERGFDRAAAILGCHRRRLWRSPGHHLDKAVRQHLADLVEPDIVIAVGGGLRQFAEHHQFRQRGGCADPPDLGAVADRFHQFGREKERQALVAAAMLMAAKVFVAGMADQDRSRHQFERFPAHPAAKTALAHIGDRMAVEMLGERLVVRSGVAPEIGHGNATALQQGRPDHALNLRLQTGRGNRQQHVEQGLAGHGSVRAFERQQPPLRDAAAIR